MRLSDLMMFSGDHKMSVKFVQVCFKKFSVESEWSVNATIIGKSAIHGYWLR